MKFTSYIGIDYSGAETPESRLKGLAVYEAKNIKGPQRIKTPDARPNGPKNWSRKIIAEWIVKKVNSEHAIIGIDHCFSLPNIWFKRQTLPNWYEMLRHFPLWWPTDKPHTYVDFTLELEDSLPPGGYTDELRITETWTPSAKSVFRFNGPGAVGKSSWAGIPWLAYIQKHAGEHVHFWPFDGWEIPENKSVITEIYPSMFSRRYQKENRNQHEHDAYSVARWLYEMDGRDKLSMYLNPPLDDEQKWIVEEREGWILGVL